MKKTPNKSTKKVPPKPKLIEGKYSHKFLTRLEPGVGAKLEKLLPVLHEKTCNGAIRRLIEHYQQIYSELQDTKQELITVRAAYNESRHKITRFTAALYDITKGTSSGLELPVDMTGKCKTCGELLDRHGECPEGCESD